MEIKEKLNKPYTNKQRTDFIVQQNHRNGYTIEETDKALIAWGYTQEELDEREKEHIAQLNMTRGDFFEGLILSVGKDEDDILALIDIIELTETERKIYKSRVKNALDFYRGYPLIDVMCGYLGIDPDNMTLFFETKDYTYLIPTPEELTVLETEEPDGEIPNNEVGDTTTTDTTSV